MARITKFIDKSGNTYSLWEVIEAAEGSGISWEEFVEQRGLEELEFRGYDANMRAIHGGDERQTNLMAVAQETNGGPGGRKPALTRFLANDDPNARDNFATAVKTNTLKGVFQQESAAVDYLYSVYNPTYSASGVQFRHAEAGYDTVEIELTNGKTGQFNLAWKGEENKRAFDEIKIFLESRRTRTLNDQTKDEIRNVFTNVQEKVEKGGAGGWFLETVAQEGLSEILGSSGYTLEEHSAWAQAITITNDQTGIKRHIYLGTGDDWGEKGHRYYSQNDENKYYARNMLDAANEVIMFLEENEDHSDEWKEEEKEFIEEIEKHLTDEVVQEVYKEMNLMDLDSEDPDAVDQIVSTIRENLDMADFWNWWSDRTEYSHLENFEIEAIIKRVYKGEVKTQKESAIFDTADQYVKWVIDNPEEAGYSDIEDFHEKYQLSKIDTFDDGTLIGASEKVIAGLNRELIYNIDALDETQIAAILKTIERHTQNINLAGDTYTASIDLATGKLIRKRKDSNLFEDAVSVENEIEKITNELIDVSLDISHLDQLKTKYETNALALSQIERILDTPITYSAMLIGDEEGKLEEISLKGTYRDVIYQKEQGFFSATTNNWNALRKKAGLSRTADFDDDDPDRIHYTITDKSFSQLQGMAPELVGTPFAGREGDQPIADWADRFKGREFLNENQKYFDDIVHGRVQENHKALMIEEEALKRMFLLNEDVTSIEKDIWQNAGHLAVGSIFGAEAVQEMWGYSERTVLDEMVNQYDQLGWELDHEQSLAVKRDFGESVVEGVSGSVGILIEFAIANKATAAIRGAKLFSKAVTVIDKAGKAKKTLKWRSFDQMLATRTAKRYSNGKQVITAAAAEQRAFKLGITKAEYLKGMRPVHGGMQQVKGFSGWRNIPANAIARGEKILWESTIEGLKFKAIGGDFTHGFGFGMAGVALTPLLGNIVNISHALQAGKKVNAPAWLVNNSVRLEKAYQLAFKGPMAFAVGTEIGEIIHQTYRSMSGLEGFGTFIDEHFENNTEFTKQFMANYVIGSFFGLTHKANIFPGKGQGLSWNLNKLKTEKGKVDHQIYERNQETGEYVGLRKEEIKWNKKTKKWEKTGKKMTEEDFVALFDIVKAYDAQIQKHVYQSNILDPIMGPTIIAREYAKQVEFYKQDGKILEYEAVNNETNPEMTNQRAKFTEVFGPDGKKTNKIKVTFNVDNYSRGVTPHELGHAGMFTLFGKNVRFKAEFMKELLEISKKIKVEQINPETNKRMTLHEQMTSLKKKWGDSWEAGRINDWEMFSYVSEALGKAENLSALQGSNAFRALGDFVQSKLGKQLNQNYDFTLQKDVVRFFGDYIESINQGTNSLKVLKHLENVIDFKETKKGDDLDIQAERAAEQGYGKNRILEMFAAKRSFEDMLGTTISGVEVGLKSENLMKTKKQLFDENVQLGQGKPEKTGEYFPADHKRVGEEMTWREVSKANSDKIREINKKIEADERNIELIDKYKKYKSETEGKEITESQKLRGDKSFEEIQKNNKEVLDLYIKTMYKNVDGGASRKNFSNYVKNTELLKIVNSYNKEMGTSFRTYLYGTLFGGGSYGGGRMGNILKALKVDMDVISKTSSLDRMMEETGFDVAEKTAVIGEGGPLTELNGSKGAELIYELNVPEVSRYIERFNEMVEKGEGPFKDIETVLNLDYKNLGDYSKTGSEIFDIVVDIMGGKGISEGAIQTRSNRIADNWRLLYEVQNQFNLMRTSGKKMGIENSLMTDQKTGEDVLYKETGETVKAAKTGAKTGTKIQEKIPLPSNGKKWFLEKLGIRDNRTEQEIADGTGNVEIINFKDRNLVLTRQYNVLSGLSKGMFNQLTRRALSEGKLPDLENRIAAETLANQIKAGGLTGKIDGVELYSELLSGFSKKFAKELGVKIGKNKGGAYLINNEGLERMQDIFIDYAFGNKKNIPKHMLNYINSFGKYEGVFETKEAAANWARIEINGYKGRVRKADFQTEFDALKMKDVVVNEGLHNEFTVSAAEIVKTMDLSASHYVYKGNKFVKENLVRERVAHSVEFAKYLPKDIINKLVKGGMTNTEASGFVKHILGLHRRLSFEGVRSEVSIKKPKISETGEIIKEGDTVVTLAESGESILGKDYTKSYDKVLKNLGKKTHADLKDLGYSFVPESKVRKANEKMSVAKTEAERIKLAEESFSKLDNKTKKDLYYAIESIKQDYIHSSKNKAEFMSRANWMYSIAKGNSNLVQGLRQTVPVKYVWFGEGKLTGDRIKLEHMKASVSQSIQTANLVVAGKFREAGKEAAADFIGLTAPETMLKFIDNQGGLVNTAGLYRMALLHPKILKQFKTVESGFKETLFDEIMRKSKVDLFGTKKFIELAKEHNLVTKKQKLDFYNKTGLNSEKLTGDMSTPEAARIVNEALAKGKMRNKKKKGMSTWDFDDTLATTKSGVRARIPNTDGLPKPNRKVIFLAGGAGSGKGNVIKKLGLERDGFKIVNQDISLEWLKKNNGLPENMNDLTKEQRSTLGKLGHQARTIAKGKMMKYQGNAEGVVVDGTGGSIKAMEGLVKEFKGKGYDVSMLFVETSLETALQRNKARKERSLLDKMVIKNHESVQGNKSGFKTMFGERFMEVKTDKLSQEDAMPNDIVEKMNDFVRSYEKIRLDAEQFAIEGKNILDKGGKFDFTEFDVITEGKQGPFFQKALERVKKFGPEGNFILTARPPEAQIPIHEFLKSQGLEIPIENITGLGNSTPEAKAMWMMKKFSEGYNDIYFADDAIQNVKAVESVLDKLKVKSKVVQARIKDVNTLDTDGLYSEVLASRKHRLEYEKTISKNRPDLVKEGLVSKSVDEMFVFVESLNIPVSKKKKYQRITTKWLATSNIKIREDRFKITDAINLAERYKEDIFSYNNPNEIIEKYAGKVKKFVNPSSVKEFSPSGNYKQRGLTTYNVENTREGQQAVRDIIDSHWGQNSNPWCITQAKNGKLTEDAWQNWRVYEKGPKRIIFQDGKLSSFYANGRYWDRMDNPTDGPPIVIKEGRVTKKVELVETSEGSGKFEEFVMETRTISKDKKTVTTEYFYDKPLDAEGYYIEAAGSKIVENRVNGVTVKETKYHPNGHVSKITEFKNTKAIESRSFRKGKTTSINNDKRLDIEKHGDQIAHETTEGKTDYWFGEISMKARGIKDAPSAHQHSGKNIFPIGFKTKAGFDVMDIMKRVDGKLRVDVQKLLKIDPDAKGLPKEIGLHSEVLSGGMQNTKAVKSVLDQLDIKSVVQKDRMSMNSENMSKNFNQILFESTGMETYKEFSPAKGKLVGKDKWNMPIVKSWGAEDFMGLTTYAFSGKGKQGEAHQEFFREHLEKPFSRAYNDIHVIKQGVSNDYKALRKQFPEVKKILNKRIDDTYTVDQAIRVYNFNKAGFEIPGLSKTDLKMLVDHVRSNEKIQYFADRISDITRLKEGYVKPKEHWLGENITMDLEAAVNDVHRKEALAEFTENREAIFGKWENGKIEGANMNKIEALYGPKHREALENILWRMEKGTNRTAGADSNTNKWMNWVNNATGTIMFFNQKSAMLQTISSLNYVNGSFNNPFAAGKAFANQPQYWKDFAKIFNSDMLLQRRSGLKINLEAQELMDRVGSQEGGFARFRSYILEKGFIPTKYADSFAIASGGATYYRNSIKKYKKQGLSEKEAEAKAWEDFSSMTEQTQQSSRPDLISMHQASALGRPILAFANTPMQMFRRHKRRIQDIANKRGDTKENIASALYYGFAQTAIFSYLANAMFAVDDESDDPKDIAFAEKKKSRYVNTILDSYLRGMGTGGASVSALKNGILSFLNESEKDYNADYGNVVVDMLNVSPPIGSKARKVYTSLKSYKHNRDAMGTMGLSLDNPAVLATANIISALTNIPTDRVVMKLTNVKDATTGDFENWQRIAMLMGINKWQMGEYEDAADAVKADLKKDKNYQKQYDKTKEKYPNKSKKEIDEIIDFKQRTKKYFKMSKKDQMLLIKIVSSKKRKYINTVGFKEEDRVKLIEKLIKDGDLNKDMVPPSLEYLFE